MKLTLAVVAALVSAFAPGAQAQTASAVDTFVVYFARPRAENPTGSCCSFIGAPCESHTGAP